MRDIRPIRTNILDRRSRDTSRDTHQILDPIISLIDRPPYKITPIFSTSYFYINFFIVIYSFRHVGYYILSENSIVNNETIKYVVNKQHVRTSTYE